MKLLILLSVILCGCTALQPSRTAQNPDATRVWMVEKDPVGDDHIIYCKVYASEQVTCSREGISK